MDSAAQAEGEKRVLAVLIEPLERLGLAKPGTLTKVKFLEMQTDICKKLAYMSNLNLAALAEQVANDPTVKRTERFPIANRILEFAAAIQPPGDDASPLLRAVFAGQLGLDAMAAGWAPELLSHLRTDRKWPGAWAVNQIKDKARDAVRDLNDIEAALARGENIGAMKEAWRARRLAALDKCAQISALGNGKGARYE
jgi:hypothetical protein